MCRVLGVSKGGFYNWACRPPSAREQEDGKIAERIVNIYQQHQGRYGSPRIHQQLQDEGIRVGRKRVIWLMKQEQLASHTTHRVMTTKAAPMATPAENVLDRAFEAERPNEKWVADVTYIGWTHRTLPPSIILARRDLKCFTQNTHGIFLSIRFYHLIPHSWP